ncbi:uncharacterized protein CTRU02_209260 [Colletotrichum truncatum]|uniref:Uncharacterized protein n=1 Tax=Colletotrichum truncatum TaxID=5467 RepID=A0ACC3YYQ9_COLTU|nr:uncharacterized protein CTRU02_14561 [Colletotrichum truncatum]KAF6782005.1 hypothetical protein CTRU02_14561 [Colletotrichum truncatum]
MYLNLLLAALPAIASAHVLQKRDYWGPAFSSGPTAGGAKIVYAAMTLTPGLPPPNPKGDLFIWPGVGGDKDLLQVVFMTAENCQADAESWCVQPYVAGPRYVNGPVGIAHANDKIRIEYKLQADKVHWVQSATNIATGKLLTSLTSDSGLHQSGVGTAVECNKDCATTVSEHTYVDWEIRLDKADPNFADTFGVSQGATYTGMTSEQGGKIWKIAKIVIPKMR